MISDETVDVEWGVLDDHHRIVPEVVSQFDDEDSIKEECDSDKLSEGKVGGHTSIY